MLSKIALAFILVISFTISLFLGNAFSKPEVKTGLWKFTTKMEMPGMPMQIPPVTNEKCITDSDLLPKTDSPNESCKFTNQKISGSTISYDIECKTQGSTTKGKVKVTYSSKKMNGTMNLTITPGNTKMTSKISGEYVGACKK